MQHITGWSYICRRELGSYFLSPIAYIVSIVFLLVTGWLFFSTFFVHGQARLDGFFQLLPYTLAIVTPALTMRLFAEELQSGSYETLVTLPISPVAIIMGKFTAAVVVMAALLAPTLVYPLTISWLAPLDWGPVAGGYLGALLLAAAYSAIGLLMSALTRNQVVAFILGVAVCLGLTLLSQMLMLVPQPLVPAFNYLAAGSHFSSIAKGVIDTRDLIYFMSVAFVALFATRWVLEERQ